MNSPCVNCGADIRVCIECDWYNGVWISEDQYEARLKADMVDLLKELQLEIEESCMCTYEVIKLIQQKINSLKEAE